MRLPSFFKEPRASYILPERTAINPEATRQAPAGNLLPSRPNQTRPGKTFVSAEVRGEVGSEWHNKEKVPTGKLH